MKRACRMACCRAVVALLLGVVGASSMAALPADWQPELQAPDEAGFWRPREPYFIRLPAPYDPAGGRLALELDNVDVTSRVAPLDESYTVFKFTPYRPLERGAHVLRLVEYKPDGRIIERGRWTVRVRLIETDFKPSVNAGVSNRVEEKLAGATTADRTVAQGSTHVETYTDDGRRRYSAVGDLLVDTNEATGAGDDRRSVDLGDFLLSRESDHTNLSAGHHFPGAIQGVGQGNLIFDGYQRRGVSGSLRAGPWDSALAGFVLRTESIRGFEDGLGVGDADHRISGGMFRVQPFANVAVGLGYVSGEGRDAGFGTGAADSGLEGNAGNLVVDTSWLDRRLSLRGEAAYSNLDLGAPFGEVSDQAYAASLAFQPLQGLQLGDRILAWNVNLAYNQLGSTFRSIGSLGQIADIEELRAGFNAYLGGLSLGVTGLRSEDNVDDGPYPTTRVQNANVNLSWTPQWGPDFGGWLFAQPSFAVNLLGDWRETVEQPSGSLAFPVDFETRGYTASANFAHALGRWGVSYGTTLTEDATDLSPDMRYDTSSLQISFQLGRRYLLAPSVGYDVSRDRDANVSTRTTQLILTQQWMLVRDRLDWTLSLGLNRSEASDDSNDMKQYTGNTRLSWYQGPATLWLEGSYFELDSRTVTSFGMLPFVAEQQQETYQVFVGISLNLPQRRMP